MLFGAECCRLWPLCGSTVCNVHWVRLVSEYGFEIIKNVSMTCCLMMNYLVKLRGWFLYVCAKSHFVQFHLPFWSFVLLEGPLLGYARATAWVRSSHCLGTLEPLLGYARATAWVRSSHCLGTLQPLLGYPRATAWVPSSHCLGTLEPLLGYARATAWVRSTHGFVPLEGTLFGTLDSFVTLVWTSFRTFRG
jgi:hypothetical protein